MNRINPISKTLCACIVNFLCRGISANLAGGDLDDAIGGFDGDRVEIASYTQFEDFQYWRRFVKK
jgi:hypothetical protein